jgi:hypothetical protein
VNALVFSALLLIAPGLPVALLVLRRTGLDRLAVLTCVPAVSITITFTVVRFWPGGSIGSNGALAYVGITVLASIATSIWAFRGGLRPHWPTKEARPRVAVQVGALGAAMTLSAIAWFSGMGTLSAPPPSADAANHGFMVARVAETGTNQPDRVLITGPEDLTPAVSYYPLGLHSTAAISAEASGADIAQTLNALLLLVMTVMLPLGVYAFTRLLVPDLPFAAAAAALLSVSVDTFPYDVISWGSLTTLTGMALALPVAALAVTMVRRAPRSWPAGILVALAMAGVFHVHNTELVVVIIAAAAVLLLDRRRDHGDTPADSSTPDSPTPDSSNRDSSNPGFWPDVGQAALRVGLVAAVLLAPYVSALANGATERSDAVGSAFGDPLYILGHIAFMAVVGNPAHRHGWLLVLSLLGVAVCIRRGRYALPALMLLAVASAWWTISGSEFFTNLTQPWYKSSERMTYNVVLLAFVAVGVIVGAVIERGATMIDRRATRPWGASIVAGAVLVVLSVVVVVPGADEGHAVVADSYRQYSPVGPDNRAAFSAAADLAGARGAVASDPYGGGLWMYALAGAQPLFALEGFDDPTYAERVGILEHLDLLGKDPGYDALVRKYRLRAVYFSERTFPTAMSLDRLRANPGLRLAFHKGDAWVFEVVAPSALHRSP